MDLTEAEWVIKNCEQESVFERRVARTVRGLVLEVDRLTQDLALAIAQRSAAFRKIEELQDRCYDQQQQLNKFDIPDPSEEKADDTGGPAAG